MRAGTPAAVVCGGIACKTTEPAPIFAPLPTSILPRILAPAPIITLREFSGDGRRWFYRYRRGDRLQDRDVVLHHRRFTDHDAGGVVEHDAAADGRRRVDVHAEGNGNLILQVDSQRLPPLLPQPVTDTVSLQRMEPFQVKQRRGYLSTAGSRSRTARISRAAETIIWLSDL